MDGAARWRNTGIASIILFASIPAAALEPNKPITHYSHSVWRTADGLPQDSVRAIAQTQDGYLWLGTQAGLARFDGVSFTTFNARNTPTLESDHIISLCASRDGSLWVGLGDFGGLARWVPNEGVVKIETGYHVRALHEDRDGLVWVGTEGRGLFRIVRGRPERFPPASALTDVRAIVQGPDGVIWLGTNGQGVYRWDGKTLAHEQIDGGPGTQNILALLADADGLWIGTRGQGLFRLRGSRREQFTVKNGLSSDVVLSLLRDSHDTLWIGTDGGGLNRYHKGRFDRYTSADGLSGDIVRAMFQDREGILWLGTAGAGLNRLEDTLFNNYGHRDGLSNDLISSMAEDQDGSVWIGTTEGWVNRISGTRIETFRPPGVMKTHRVGSLFTDEWDNLWASLYESPGPRIALVRGGRGVRPSVPALPETRVRTVLHGANGTTWIGTSDGLAELRSGRVTAMYTAADGLPSNSVLALARDRSGALWAGTPSGVARRMGARFVTFNDPSAPQRGRRVNTMLADSAGSIWIGTMGQGLYRYREGRFTHYDESNGIPDSRIVAILEDGRRHLWMASRRGICRVAVSDIDAFDKGRLRRIPVVVYENLDGVRSTELNYEASPPAMRTRDGRLWFATYGGALFIDPERIQAPPRPPDVYITRVLADRSQVRMDPLLKLAPSQNYFEIHYTAPAFRAPQRVRFRYRLEGIDQDWIEADTRRVAYYTNVRAGQYRFRVIACNSEGVWNEDGAVLDLVKEPHIYETSSFWCAIGACVGLALLLIYRARVKYLRDREAYLVSRVDQRTRELRQEVEVRRAAEAAAEAANRSKSDFLANMSHEIRTPINGIIGMTELALARCADAEEKEYLAIAQSSSKTLLGLINDILDLSRIEAGKLAIETIECDPRRVVNDVVQLLRFSDSAKGLELVCDVDRAVPSWILADPLRLGQVLFNLVGNAMKFTAKGRVDVRLNFDAECRALRFSVKDTGIGIPKEKQAAIFEAFTQADASTARKFGGAGLGLAISARLVTLMGGSIRVESAPEQGALFEFTIPYEAPAQEPRTVPQVELAPSRSMRILVAEDNSVNQLLVRRLLEKEGHSVVIAGNGVEAVLQSQGEQFDAILMDVQMPEMDGVDAARAIRRREENTGGHVPIIAVTAGVMDDDRERCLEAGMDGFVAKPIQRAELLARLAAIEAERCVGSVLPLARVLHHYGECAGTPVRDLAGRAPRSAMQP